MALRDFLKRPQPVSRRLAAALPAKRSSATGPLLLAAAAAALAGAAAYEHRRARQAEAAHPPTGRFVEVDGVRLHYVERGEGQPLVLFHGNGTMAEDFALARIVERAAAHYRVIAFDRPGFGYSERPRDRVWTPSAQARLFQQAFEQLGIERPVVVGHSWGTLVALALALDFPRALKSIVLLSGYYFPSLRKEVPFLSIPAIPVIGDILRHTLSPLLGRLMAPAAIRKAFAPSPVPPSFEDFPVELSLRPSQLRASAEETALMVPAAALLARRYGELRVPVVLLSGTGDRIVDVHAQTERLGRELGKASLTTVEGAGHMIHHIAPNRVMAAIDQAAAA